MQGRNSTRILWLAALVALGGAAAYVFWLAARQRSDAANDSASEIAQGSGAPSDSHAPARDGTSELGAHPRQQSRISDETRALARALHTAVRVARARGREPSPAAPVVPVAPNPEAEREEPRGSLDPQYIRDAVRELRPLLVECYERALEEQGDLEGSLVVEFTIEGEPEVGGVVEETRIADASTLRHPSLDECVRETMYTLRLPAPDGSGSVHVRYPFRFAREDDSADGAAGTDDIDGG